MRNEEEWAEQEEEVQRAQKPRERGRKVCSVVGSVSDKQTKKVLPGCGASEPLGTVPHMKQFPWSHGSITLSRTDCE